MKDKIAHRPSLNKKISLAVGISEEAVTLIRSFFFNNVFTRSLVKNINYLEEKIQEKEDTLNVYKEVLQFFENGEIERIESVLKKS